MKCAVARESARSFKREVVSDVCRDIVENATEPNLIETMRGGFGGRACPAVAILLQESGRKRQRGGFDVHTACGRLDCKLGEERTSNLINDAVADADARRIEWAGATGRLKSSFNRSNSAVAGTDAWSGDWRGYHDLLANPSWAQPDRTDFRHRLLAESCSGSPDETIFAAGNNQQISTC